MYCLWRYSNRLPRTTPENWPAPSFHHSTCATFRGHISNSWALVCCSVISPCDGLYVPRCLTELCEAWCRQCERTSRRLVMPDAWRSRRRNNDVHTHVRTHRETLGHDRRTPGLSQRRILCWLTRRVRYFPAASSYSYRDSEIPLWESPRTFPSPPLKLEKKRKSGNCDALQLETARVLYIYIYEAHRLVHQPTDSTLP